jgi:hypothetical protein
MRRAASPLVAIWCVADQAKGLPEEIDGLLVGLGHDPAGSFPRVPRAASLDTMAGRSPSRTGQQPLNPCWRASRFRPSSIMRTTEVVDEQGHCVLGEGGCNDR